MQEGVFCEWEGSYILQGEKRPLRDHPPPKPPFQYPSSDKMGTNLLLFEFCIHLHTHQDIKLKCRRVMGQRLRHGRPCTHDLPGTHNWLAHCSISSDFYYLMLALSWKSGVNCCSIGLSYPAACLCLCLWDTFTDFPFCPICSKRVPIDWT